VANHTGEGLTRLPLLVLGCQADDSAALRSDQIGGRDAHGEPQARRLPHDLVGGVDGAAGPPDLGHGLHILHALEHLDADRRGFQPQQAKQVLGQNRAVDRRGRNSGNVRHVEPPKEKPSRGRCASP
jgi:hypothetical protein